LQGIEFVKDVKTKERFPANTGIGVQIGRRALANGLLCRFDPHWLAFGPALNVTEAQLNDMMGVLERTMAEVVNATTH
jgi:adenosylmethionine-8-amino-7-oxononanoate aminotransferase